jgi:hypothetical protein
MMRRFFFALLVLVVTAGSLGAQIRRQRTYATGDPGVWFSAGVGGFTSTGVNDGRSGSRWDFGNSTNLEYRATLEKAIDNGSSFGISGSWAHVPFAYSSNTPIPISPDVTGARCALCDAHLDMLTLLVTFHSGSGQGFHQVVELNGGVVAYRNLKQDSDGAALAPSHGDLDPLFSIGYGLGYGFGNRVSLDFVPDYAIAIHERSGLSNGVSNTNSMRSLRLALRMGFGSHTVTR